MLLQKAPVAGIIPVVTESFNGLKITNVIDLYCSSWNLLLLPCRKCYYLFCIKSKIFMYVYIFLKRL